jgi:hypothetical protein
MKLRILFFSLLLFTSTSFPMVQNDIQLHANVGYQSLFTAGAIMTLKHIGMSFDYGYISNSEYELIWSLHYLFRFENNDIFRIGLGIDFENNNKLDSLNIYLPLQACYTKSIFHSEYNFVNFELRFNNGETNVEHFFGFHIGYTLLIKSSKIF